MKIVYCVSSLYASGGMERVLMLKANYLADVLGYNVSFVTTEQKKRSFFFPFSKTISFYDLDINYSDSDKWCLGIRFWIKMQQKIKHKIELSKLLRKIQPDITVSTGCQEFSFLHQVNDGSVKILEYHFSKYAYLEIENPIWRFYESFKSRYLGMVAKKYAKFILLTEEDKSYWGGIENSCVIHNPSISVVDRVSTLENKRVVAVGRYARQKGFDLLIMAWDKVSKKFPDWELDVYGDGPLRNELSGMIESYNLDNSVFLKGKTENIIDKYLNSSIFVLSSRHEGLPMVMQEAMSCGLPVVAFTCKCGPKDIINEDGVNGVLVNDGDVNDLSEALINLMGDIELRKRISIHSLERSRCFSIDLIMGKWDELFKQVLSRG